MDLERFDPEITVLNRGNFTIPGKGQSPDYCHAPFISHIKADGSGAKEMIITCKLARCPSCYRLWIDQKVFDYAVMVESYASITGSRPARGVSSVDPEVARAGMTLGDLRRFQRNTNDRIKRCGVDAGIKIFHSFRIKKDVQDALRDILGACREEGSVISSRAFWDALDSSENIDCINDILGTDYASWRQCVDLSPHIHMLTFPGDQKFTGDKNIMIKKLSTVVDGEKKWTLDHVRDVVYHIRYLIGHCGILINAGKNRVEPMNSFGELWRFKPEEHLSADELEDIRQSVLEVLNDGRETLLEYDEEGILSYVHDDSDLEDEVVDDYVPIREFVPYGMMQRESLDAWLASIDVLDNRNYCTYLIDLFCDILDDPDRPSKMKRLYTADLQDPPGSFKIVSRFVDGGKS